MTTPHYTQYDTMNGLFKVCGYPTASQADMESWNNLDNGSQSVAAGAAGLFSDEATIGGVMSVGLF